MQRCEEIKNDTTQIAANALPQALVHTLFVELQDLIDPHWIEFADLCHQLIYPGETSNMTNSVKDTLDAIFVDKAGCQRLLKMRVSMAVFVFQRLLPNASEAPVLNMDDGQVHAIASLDPASRGDRASLMLLWVVLLGAKTLEGLKDIINPMQASTHVGRRGVKSYKTEEATASAPSPPPPL